MRLLTEHSHLTQGNKTAIKAILSAGLVSGRVGRTNYFLSKIGESKYSVTILIKERHCIGADLAVTKSTHEFTI